MFVSWWKWYGYIFLCIIATVWCNTVPSLLNLQNTSDIYYSFRERWKRQVSCGSSSFLCKSGQCIENSKICDGFPHCQDSSDETREACERLNHRCPPFAFRCYYGACIDGDKKCDGNVDCVDQSDEKVPGCKTFANKPTSSPITSSNCQATEFACDSGQCISQFLICDGKKDCNDGSDETSKCRKIRCSEYTFRCSYGACIEREGKCDGIMQCADSSDEDPFLCNTATPPSSSPASPVITVPPAGSCAMPGQPANGNFIVNGCENGDTDPVCKKIPGTPVTRPLLLTFSCNIGYQIEGNDKIICYNGKWLPSTPECVPATCQPLISSSVEILCKHNNQVIPCDKPMEAGSEAHLECKVAYQLPNEPGYRKIYCGSNGQWNSPLFSCTPVCGIRTPKGTPAVSHGLDAQVGEFPWHVGIYKKSKKDGKYQQVCGGSLISDKMVVSAAHCFWDERTKQLIPNERFKLAVGKYNRDFYFPDTEAQYTEPEEIKIAERYQGRTLNFANDIAVVVMNISVELTWAVSPVCIDWNNEYERFQLVPGNVGSVAGWGITEEQQPSQVIKTAQLPFIDFDKCWKTIPERFQTYVTRDKFCAGYTNGTSVCPGDSGGGLVFQTDKVWYLRGIVSVGVGPEGDDKCFTDQYTAFTQVSQFRDFLKSAAKQQ